MNGWTKQMIFSYLSKHMEFQVNESFCQLFCVQTFNSVIFGLYLHCFAHVLSYSHARTHTQLHTIYKWNAKKLECLFSKDGKINQCYIGQGRDICCVAKITESEIKSSVFSVLGGWKEEQTPASWLFPCHKKAILFDFLEHFRSRSCENATKNSTGSVKTVWPGLLDVLRLLYLMSLSLSGVCSFNTTTTIVNVNDSVLQFHFDETNEAICLILFIRSVYNSSRRFLLNSIFMSINSRSGESLFSWRYAPWFWCSTTLITLSLELLPAFFHFLLLLLQFVVLAAAAAGCYSYSLRTLICEKINSLHTSWLVLSTNPCILKFCLSLINWIKLNMLISH